MLVVRGEQLVAVGTRFDSKFFWYQTIKKEEEAAMPFYEKVSDPRKIKFVRGPYRPENEGMLFNDPGIRDSSLMEGWRICQNSESNPKNYPEEHTHFTYHVELVRKNVPTLITKAA